MNKDDAIKQAWLKNQETTRALNEAIRDKFHVGQKVKALWNREWRDCEVTWVPYPNSPNSQAYVYVQFPGHKSSKKYEMGGGVFNYIRTGDFDGVALS